MASEKINVALIFEMMGRPAEYLKESLGVYLDKLGSEKGIVITTRKINEPKEVENSPLLTTFAEVEVELESMQKLIGIIFGYMPSNVEVIKPEELRIKNHDLNVTANEIARRMHEYDAVAKAMLFEKNILVNQLKENNIAPAIGQPAAEIKESKKSKPGKKKKKS